MPSVWTFHFVMERADVFDVVETQNMGAPSSLLRDSIDLRVEYTTETREELLYNKEKLLANGDRCVKRV
jgi:hypothetical protein